MKVEVTIQPNGYVCVRGTFEPREMGLAGTWHIQFVTFRALSKPDELRFGIFSDNKVLWSVPSSEGIPYVDALLDYEAYMAETYIPPERVGERFITILPNPIVPDCCPRPEIHTVADESPRASPYSVEWDILPLLFLFRSWSSVYLSLCR